MGTLLALALLTGTLWWSVFALKPYEITPQQLDARYDHTGEPATRGGALQLGALQPIQVGQTPAWAADLRLTSFDGDTALGRIVYPADPALAQSSQRWPVLLALHGMGRTQWRWWQPAYKGRPTIESTHLLAEQALQHGLVLVALDARAHGDRKDPVKPLIVRELMRNMDLWGEREPYERLIVDTVRDYRVLLDWVVAQPQLDAGRISATGYSMGAQMALLLAGTDARVQAVAAMVPPQVDDKVAVVAPSNVVQRLGDRSVWLLTAEDDDYADAKANAALFAALPGANKRHLSFPGGHLLPASYVESLQPWLAAQGQPRPALRQATVPDSKD